MGGGLSVLSSLSSDELPQTDPSSCKHLFCEKWGPNHFHCADCHGTLTDEDRIREEDRIIDSIVDESVAEDGVNRGVTIQFLVDFANACNCWDMTTRDVRRRFVMPATRSSRCRFVELPEMSGVVGRAVTFVSHTWGAEFGDLVAAVCDGGADRSRRVWVDIFAVRQWPSAKPDLDFSAVVRQCSSFLIVCSSFPEFANVNPDYVMGSKVSIPPHLRVQIAFLRVWCLVEVHAAILHNVAIILKVGSWEARYDGVCFAPCREVALNLLYLIDIEAAEATVASDKERILNGIRECEGGVSAVNAAVRGVISGSAIAGGEEVVCAACGDEKALNEIVTKPSDFIVAAAGSGYFQILKRLIEAGADVNEGGEFLPLSAAALGGHLRCVKLLIENGANVNESTDGTSALWSAAGGGHLSCVKYLIESGADMKMSWEGDTPLTIAAKMGHFECAEFLIQCGADINDVSTGGMTVLMYTAMRGHAACVDLLLKKGCDANLKCSKGKTALMYAVESGNAHVLSYCRSRKYLLLNTINVL